MKGRICLVMILMLAMILSASFADEDLTVSGRVNAEQYADQALEQNYGITQLLQEYLIRTAEEKDDDVFIVRYEGLENYAYVLGRYEVTVDRNQVVGITWSHDGEDTSGGFDAEAWGAEQIMEMLRLNQEAEGTDPFDARVAEISEKHGFYYAPVVLSEEELKCTRDFGQLEFLTAPTVRTLRFWKSPVIRQMIFRSPYISDKEVCKGYSRGMPRPSDRCTVSYALL